MIQFHFDLLILEILGQSDSTTGSIGGKTLHSTYY